MEVEQHRSRRRSVVPVDEELPGAVAHRRAVPEGAVGAPEELPRGQGLLTEEHRRQVDTVEHGRLRRSGALGRLTGAGADQRQQRRHDVEGRGELVRLGPRGDAAGPDRDRRHAVPALPIGGLQSAQGTVRAPLGGAVVREEPHQGPVRDAVPLEGVEDLADARVHLLHHVAVGPPAVGDRAPRVELAADGAVGGVVRPLERVVGGVVRQVQEEGPVVVPVDEPQPCSVTRWVA